MHGILDSIFSSQLSADSTMSMSIDHYKFFSWRRDASPLMLLTSEPNPHFHSRSNYIGALKTSISSSNFNDPRKKRMFGTGFVRVWQTTYLHCGFFLGMGDMLELCEAK